jgi:hypothetical protein
VLVTLWSRAELSRGQVIERADGPLDDLVFPFEVAKPFLAAQRLKAHDLSRKEHDLDVAKPFLAAQRLKEQDACHDELAIQRCKALSRGSAIEMTVMTTGSIATA